MSRLQELRGSLGSLDDKSKKILDVAEEEKRSLTAEETQEWDRIDEEITSITAEIDLRQRQAKRSAGLEKSNGRKSAAIDPQDQLEPSVAKAIEYNLGKSVGTITIEPGSKAFSRDSKEYAAAFRDYLVNGHVRADLQVTPDTKGGYLTTTRFVAELIKKIDDDTVMRQICTVLPPLGRALSLGVPTLDTNPNDADWSAEVPASDISDDTAMAFGKRELMPHLSTKLIKVSDLLMRTAVINPETIVRDRLAYVFGITEEKAFLTGDGAQKPLGVFVASSDGISTTRDTTAASQTTITADELIDTKHAIKGGYWSNLTWVMHRDTLKIIRKLKDGNGQYMWSPGIAGGDPHTILDTPYVLNENAPNTFTSGLYTLIIGDFSKYWIADSMDLEIKVLGELFALKNRIGFKGGKYTDGMPVLEEAFQRLILQ